MKPRGSIVGPIIVILIGALFLANNLRPDLPMLEFLGRYWPFLLIGWGVVRLLEVLFWAVTRKPLPNSGISGGEWVLVVFLTLIGSGLYAFHSAGHSWPVFGRRGIEMFGETFDYAIDEQRVPAAKDTHITLEHLRGNARIVGGDVAEVRVVGRKVVRSMSRKQADEVNTLTGLEVAQQSGGILIRTNQHKAPQERYVTADIEITVPRGATVQAKGHDGDYDITDIQGAVELDSDRAGVRLDNIGGNVRVNLRRSDLVRAHAVQGSVDLRGRGNDIEFDGVQGQVTIEGSWGGEIRMRNVAKPIRYDGQQAEFQAQKVDGEIRLTRGSVEGESLSGPIVLRGHTKGCCDIKLSEFNSRLDVSVQRGDIELRPASNPLPRIEVDLRNGNIDLALPPTAKFNLRARAEKGDVENDFGDALKLTNEDRGGLLTGSVGEGPQITMTSGRGTITVRKADNTVPSAPLTPQPPRSPRPVRAEVN